MIDLYLCAPTEADMTAALTAAGLIDDEGLPVAGVTLDHIGEIEGATGWHTNLRLVEDIDTSALLGYIIDTPTTPYRVWA
jgi:hypothetical protein